jgi:hypothetical protein
MLEVPEMNANYTPTKPQNTFPFDVTSRQPQQQLGVVKPTTAKPPAAEKAERQPPPGK